MKKFFIALLVMASALSITAEAKRLGGGGSFGKQSQSLNRPPAQAPSQGASPAKPAAPPAAAPQTPPKPASPWRGILGGALLGLGLGALMSHFGLGGAFGSILMIALLAIAVMFIIRMFRRKSDGNNASAYAAGYPSVSTPEIGSRIETTGAQPVALQSVPVAAASNVAPFGVPADFDVPAFLRNAKIYFIRLQAAWDKADINDIREFATPEMFAELKMQIQERGTSPNNTDAVTLNAELMGVETLGSDYLATVKFSGMIKEAENAPAEPFTEVWNLSKPMSGQGGWVLAGIQQLS
ncbi:Tim44 domain-containing protein [Undibacterium arcticum]|uniref:Tim44 domain-containing protein n=1 Tax=Undibacterium arcticum TaxID=1762892 RepID=A0ABV7EVI6_9BURK